MDSAAYLNRIGYGGPLDPTAETLRRLHVAHLLSVPFENLSIHAGEPIVLDDEALFEKVVVRRRGGFCYELNGLFAALLRALGFRVEMLSAGVMNRAGEFGPEFDHMALLVTLEQRWLADVGFGDSFVEPLLVDERREQVQGSRAFRIDDDGGRLVLVRREEGGEWEAQYRFGLELHAYVEYAGMCRYHQSSPESHFTRGRVCSRLTADGRVTISGTRLITTSGNERHERELAGEEEYAESLREHFGIVMPQNAFLGRSAAPAGNLTVLLSAVIDIPSADLEEFLPAARPAPTLEPTCVRHVFTARVDELGEGKLILHGHDPLGPLQDAGYRLHPSTFHNLTTAL